MHNPVILALAFLAGVLCVQGLEWLPDWPVIPIGILGLLLCALKPSRLIGMVIIGFIWALWVGQNQLQHRLPAAYEGQDLLLEGTVIDLPQAEDHSTRFLLQVDAVKSHPELTALPNRIRLSWYRDAPAMQAGERWQLTVRLKQPHGFSNPHGFDYEAWLFQRGIGATGYVRQSPENLRLAAASIWSLGHWRQALSDWIPKPLANSPNVALIQALAIGDRRALTPHQWTVLQATGTSHLLAISGLHIGLVAGMGMLLVWARLKLGLHGAQVDPRWMWVVAIVLSGAYAMMSGFQVPAQRAWVMVVVWSLAMMMQRHIGPLQAFGWALLAVLCWDPTSVLSAGFWLSFGAVGWLFWALGGRLSSTSKSRQLLRAQWVLAFGMAPLTLLFFDAASLWMPVANLIAIPWVSILVLPLVLMADLLLLLNQTAADWVLKLTDFSLSGLWWVLEWMTQVELPQMRSAQASIASVGVAILGAMWLSAPAGVPGRRIAPVLFVPLLYPGIEAIQPGEAKVTLLDVGQGLSTVVQTRHHSLVFDTGAKWSDRFNAADAVLVPYLQGHQVDRIDHLILSHTDNDHAGAADALRSKVKVNELWSSDPDYFSDWSVRACHRGIQWVWDGVQFEFLHPDPDDHLTGNNASCVLRVSTSGETVLLTGDIERLAESRLIEEQPDRIQADLLIAPHHGSATSSSEAFIRQVDPRWVWFPVGYRNRFQFPAQSVLQRYQKQGIEAFDTATHGALSVTLGRSGGMSVQAHREASRRYWHWLPQSTPADP